ncbi:hypothetical protein ABPG72_022839 [Tetrahymena utriculariae]
MGNQYIPKPSNLDGKTQKKGFVESKEKGLITYQIFFPPYSTQHIIKFKGTQYLFEIIYQENRNGLSDEIQLRRKVVFNSKLPLKQQYNKGIAEWRTEYACSNAPAYNNIKNIVNKFHESGSVQNNPPKNFLKSEKRKETKQIIEEMIEETSTLSIRNLSKEANISVGTTFDILHNDLQLKPYKQQHVQQLYDEDYDKRITFANWILSLPKNHISKIICSDESIFMLTQTINKQNDRQWMSSKPNSQIEKPQFDQKLHVWVAFSSKKMYTPYFFDGNVKNYKQYYFQQDGATSHTASVFLDWLVQKFKEKFIKKEMWPPRSLDLNPCDYYLWGYLKSVVYQLIPQNLEELKANIIREINNINIVQLQNSFNNLQKRCKQILLNEGSHIKKL